MGTYENNSITFAVSPHSGGGPSRVTMGTSVMNSDEGEGVCGWFHAVLDLGAAEAV